jgi:hypothetical protein
VVSGEGLSLVPLKRLAQGIAVAGGSPVPDGIDDVGVTAACDGCVTALLSEVVGGQDQEVIDRRSLGLMDRGRIAVRQVTVVEVSQWEPHRPPVGDADGEITVAADLGDRSSGAVGDPQARVVTEADDPVADAVADPIDQELVGGEAVPALQPSPGGGVQGVDLPPECDDDQHVLAPHEAPAGGLGHRGDGGVQGSGAVHAAVPVEEVEGPFGVSGPERGDGLSFDGVALAAVLGEPDGVGAGGEAAKAPPAWISGSCIGSPTRTTVASARVA